MITRDLSSRRRRGVRIPTLSSEPSSVTRPAPRPEEARNRSTEPTDSITVLRGTFTRDLPNPVLLRQRKIRLPASRYSFAKESFRLYGGLSRHHRGLSSERNHRLGETRA